MYFFKEGGKQVLDLRGDLVISHNDGLVKCRSKSAAPASVKNAKYILNIKKAWGFWYRVRATFAVIRFIWGRNEALKNPPKLERVK